MKTSKQLREERAKLIGEIRTLADKSNDEKQEFGAEDQERWKKVNADYDSMTAQVQMAERVEAIEADSRIVVAPSPGRGDIRPEGQMDDRPTDEDRALAFQAWFRAQAGKSLGDEHREAAELCGINLAVKELVLEMYGSRRARQLRRERRAAMSTSAGTGGETIPEGFVNNFEIALLAYGGLRQVATILRTDKGNDLPWPTTDDTANKGALIGESTADDEKEVATGSMILGAYKYTSKIIRIPTELLEDSAFDLVSFAGERCGERIGRILADHFAVGTGSAQPNGIVPASTLGVTAASSTAVTANELVELVHSVDPAYRGFPGCGWGFHDNVLLAVRKLKDSDGQYMWQPGMRVGVPDMLFGYPYTILQSMSSTITAGDKVAIFGALAKYIIRDVRELRLKHLVERYAEYDQDAFIAYSRHDGDLLDAGTNPVKHYIMAGAGS